MKNISFSGASRSAETGTRGVLRKKLFLKIWQYSQETGLESILNNAAGFQACSVIKKRLQRRCFPVNIAKFLRTPILKNICERLILGAYCFF